MRNLNPDFSIIIPVYNVQEYLEICVESVLQQTFRDYEIILVDDGSKDRSGELCDQLAKKDPRIRVIHQENQGLSGARNNGLLLASGAYILFLDSDDFYPQKDFLEHLYSVCNGKDVICFNYARYTHRLLPVMISYPEDRDMPQDELWLELIRRNAYQSSAWSKAVKRTVLTENDIMFETGILSEDIEWSAKVMSCAKSIALAPECVYAYRVRPGSITKSVSSRHVDDQIRIVKRLAECTKKGTEAFCVAYNGYVAFQYSTLMINARLCKPRLKKDKLQEIKKLAWLLQYDTNRVVKLIHTVYNMLGFEITSWLLLVYFKLFCK